MNVRKHCSYQTQWESCTYELTAVVTVGIRHAHAQTRQEMEGSYEVSPLDKEL